MATLFSGNMKLSELIDLNYELLLVFSRLGMHLGYADCTVTEACEKSGIDTATFLMICNVYTYSDYLPSAQTLEECKAEDVVNYVHDSHEYYLTYALVRLENSLEKLLEPCNDKQRQVIWSFFAGYKAELLKHFSLEEEQVLPYVSALLRHERRPDYSIETFEDNHSNVDEKLEDLKNIVMKYLPGDCDDRLRAQVLIFIYSLKEDLQRHTSIENNILVPLTRRCERNGE